MKRRWPLLVFTLLLVAAGAAMPFAASWMQDGRQAETETRPFDSFSLTLQQRSDLGRTLRVMEDGRFTTNDGVRAETAVLTEALALEAAENVLEALVKYGLLEERVRSGPVVEAREVLDIVAIGMSTEDIPPDTHVLPTGEIVSDEVIPTWLVTWTDPEYAFVWLDDASSKAVWISIPSPMLDPEDGVYGQADQWELFMEDYYGVEVTLSDLEWLEYSVRFTFSLPQGEDGEDCHLMLSLFADGYAALSPPLGNNSILG